MTSPTPAPVTDPVTPVAATPVLRRSVLGGLAVTGLAAASLPAAARAAAPLRAPFTLGVASGDPLPDGVVLWTRLAPEPLAPDGRGGMPSRAVVVEWELAEDERFRRVVRRGSMPARVRSAHAVHVEVDGLLPGREYFYRFRAEGHVSPVGRTRTAPAYGARVRDLTAAVVSCSQFEHGFFTAYRRVAEEQPELVVHLGDYLYEYRAGDYVAPGGNPRDHEGPETRDLAGYRQRHAQYRTDLDLQAAHAAAPWSVVFDDHEVENNWADDVPETPDPGFPQRRAAAFQAYWENMPLRRSALPRGADMQVYRRLQWGDLMTLHLMDTRQYRDDQACGDGAVVDCAERLEPGRTLPGWQQERWLLDGLGRSRSTWDVLGQQVFFAQRDFAAGPTQRLSMDGWDGYAASRRRITRGIVERGVRNPVVFTGDVHRHYANDLKVDYDDPGSRTVGVELSTTSITSGGDGSDRTPDTDVQLAENPHIRFANSQRGYVMTRFTHDRLEADFKVLPYVSRPGAPATTRTTLVVEDRRPGWQVG